MSFDTLYSDVFYCILDYLELDDIARLSGTNHETHTICTEYVPRVSELTLDTLQYRYCIHQESLSPIRTSTGYVIFAPEQCRTVDKSSIEYKYCKNHIEKHTCSDCATIREQLDKEDACADGGCCYKFICRLEDGGCTPLQCWSCKAYHDVISMFKYIGPENRKDRLCHDCVHQHNVTDLFVSCITWWGLSLEEAQRRRGY